MSRRTVVSADGLLLAPSTTDFSAFYALPDVPSFAVLGTARFHVEIQLTHPPQAVAIDGSALDPRQNITLKPGTTNVWRCEFPLADASNRAQYGLAYGAVMGDVYDQSPRLYRTYDVESTAATLSTSAEPAQDIAPLNSVVIAQVPAVLVLPGYNAPFVSYAFSSDDGNRPQVSTSASYRASFKTPGVHTVTCVGLTAAGDRVTATVQVRVLPIPTPPPPSAPPPADPPPFAFVHSIAGTGDGARVTFE